MKAVGEREFVRRFSMIKDSNRRHSKDVKRPPSSRQKKQPPLSERAPVERGELMRSI